MMKRTSIPLCLVGLVLIASAASSQIVIQPNSLDRERVAIFPDAVYVIRNKGDDTVLTTVDFRADSEAPAASQTYNNLPGQKWRLEKASFGTSFRLVPTSNEKASLDLDADTLGVWGRLVSFGNQKYWNFIGMGEGVVQIQNYLKPEFCMTSLGVGKSLEVEQCMNHANQQWILQKL